MSKVSKKNQKSSTQLSRAPKKAVTLKKSSSFPVVAIGASAGGLEALLTFLKYIPAKTGMAYVYVQHQDPKHRSALSDILKNATSLPILEIQSGMMVERDHFYVIPSNADVQIQSGIFYLSPRTAQRGRHMPIDHFFRSLAEERQNKAIGVVLSGTASDGTLGLRAIKAAGGITFAQKESTARYQDMPRNAIESGSVDFIRSPEAIAHELDRIARHPHLMESFANESKIAENETELREIFILLRKSTGVDFSQYKPATIHRRISRRLVLHKLQRLDEYLAFMKQNPSEVEKLYNDILIHVTSFFRDPDVFEVLKTQIFPGMAARRGEDSIRIWVPGCSTGEEPYSLAIELLEFFGEDSVNTPIQIFGTDISELAISKARSGLYPAGIADDISAARLKKYFTYSDRGYQIIKTVRDRCIFARQNVVKDPPFTKLDLISCRNLLIYLGEAAQRKILPIFHYALKPEGCLLLGSSEAISSSKQLFTAIDKRSKVYCKNPVAARIQLDAYEVPMPFSQETTEKGVLSGEITSVNEVVKEGERLILSRYGPAGVIVDQSMEILQFRGRVGPYLEPAHGKASLNLLKMAREGILTELRNAIQEATRTRTSVKREGLLIISDGKSTTLNLEVIPFKTHASSNLYFMVLFESVSPSAPSKPSKKNKTRKKLEDLDEVAILRQELTGTKEYLQSVIEEQEAVNEELKAANEEMLSSNEELQSTNEELETAKEELQSSNEELTTVNEELQIRNAELDAANDDWNNLIRSLQLPMMMVDQSLKISRFTPDAERVFNLIQTDRGRPITDINLNIDINLASVINEVMVTQKKKEIEFRDPGDHTYSLQIHPYRRDNLVAGAVLLVFEMNSVSNS